MENDYSDKCNISESEVMKNLGVCEEDPNNASRIDRANIKLRAELLAVEKERRAGISGYTPEEVEHYLNENIDEVEHVR